MLVVNSMYVTQITKLRDTAVELLDRSNQWPPYALCRILGCHRAGYDYTTQDCAISTVGRYIHTNF